MFFGEKRAFRKSISMEIDSLTMSIEKNKHLIRKYSNGKNKNDALVEKLQKENDENFARLKKIETGSDR